MKFDALMQKPVVMLLLTLMSVGGLSGDGSFSKVCADDDLDRQLQESLKAEENPESPLTIIDRLLNNTANAGARLEAGQLDEQTTSLQQKILDDLDVLLDQSATPPPDNSSSPSAADSPSPSSASASSAQQQTGEGTSVEKSSGRQEQTSMNNPNAVSRESTERTTAGQETAAERERRLGMATAAWGHLPPKVREQMRSAFSETYLPEYDELVRRYYEALAARREQRETPAAP